MAVQVPCLKLCSLQEVSDSNCVYRNVVDHAAGEFTQVLFEDVASDPTLPRTKSVRCAACGHGEAVFFQVGIMLVLSSSVGSEFQSSDLTSEPPCPSRWRRRRRGARKA